MMRRRRGGRGDAVWVGLLIGNDLGGSGEREMVVRWSRHDFTNWRLPFCGSLPRNQGMSALWDGSWSFGPLLGSLRVSSLYYRTVSHVVVHLNGHGSESAQTLVSGRLVEWLRYRRYRRCLRYHALVLSWWVDKRRTWQYIASVLLSFRLLSLWW